MNSARFFVSNSILFENNLIARIFDLLELNLFLLILLTSFASIWILLSFWSSKLFEYNSNKFWLNNANLFVSKSILFEIGSIVLIPDLLELKLVK